MIPKDGCGILTMKEEIIRSSYISIVLYRIEQENSMDLNAKLDPLPIRLKFWIILILDFVFAHNALGGLTFLPNKSSISRL